MALKDSVGLDDKVYCFPYLYAENWGIFLGILKQGEGEGRRGVRRNWHLMPVGTSSVETWRGSWFFKGGLGSVDVRTPVALGTLKRP